MKHSERMIKLVPLCLLLLGACKERTPANEARGTARKTVKPPADDCQAASCPRLRWVPGGSGLVVDGRWLLDPVEGQFAPLSFEADDPLPSPNGEELLVKTGAEFGVAPLRGALGSPLEIPVFIDLSRITDGGRDLQHESDLLAWRSQDEILVHQQYSNGSDFKVACQIYNRQDGIWIKPPVSCPKGEMAEIDAIEFGPENWMAVYSSGEGHDGVMVSKYDPQVGQKDGGVPRFDLHPGGFLQVAFNEDGDELMFITSCDLEKGKRPCQDKDGDPFPLSPLRLYRWSVSDEDLTLDRSDLPFRTLIDGRSGKLAWPKPGKVCTGDPSAEGEKRCFVVPK